MTKIEKYFKKMLAEAEIPEVDDSQAFNNALDDGTDPESFSTEPQAPGFQSKYMDKAKGWIKKIEVFSDWVNGTEVESLNKAFNDLDYEGSPFEGISKDSHTLTKIAEDLASLSETIKGYILSADNKSRKQQNESVKKKFLKESSPVSNNLKRFWSWMKNNYNGVMVSASHIDEYPATEPWSKEDLDYLENNWIGKWVSWAPDRGHRWDYGDDQGDFYDTEAGLDYRQRRRDRRMGLTDRVPPSRRDF